MNSPWQMKILNDWNWARQLLNPSQRDWDHGLELHHQSVICDSFSIGFSAATPGERIRKAMLEEGAPRAQVVDMMAEAMVLGWADDPAQRDELAGTLDMIGLTFWFQNVECAETGLAQIKRLARYLYLADALRPRLTRLVEAEDIQEVHRRRAHAMAFSMNHVPLDPGDKPLDFISIFRCLGVRMMHLTYNAPNAIGCGCHAARDTGLTDLGRAVVAEMNRVGIIVDVAHCGWQTSMAAAKHSTRPMVASHTTCHALHAHPRGKPDAVIRAIADTGGFIGITCVPAFLGGAGTIVNFMDHLAYAVKTFGADHIAIGTDIPYGSPRAIEEAAKYPRPSLFYAANQSPSAPPAADLNVPDDPPETPDQLRSLALTNWPVFTVGLVQRGFSDDQIRRIIGENVVRVLKANS